MAKCTQDNTYCCDINDLVAKLKIVSEANRLKIICLLKGGERCVCEIIEELKLAQNLVSHHLAVLRKADIVCTRKQGTNIYYKLNNEVINKLKNTFTGLLD